jgi:tight adherence protein C
VDPVFAGGRVIGLAATLAAIAVLASHAAWHEALGGSVAVRLPAAAVDGSRPEGASVLARMTRSRLARRLDTVRARDALAGGGWAVPPERFAGIRVACATVGAGLGFAVALVVAVPGVALVPLLAFVGARLPLFIAARAARHRRAAIDREVPQLLDLVAAGSSAGLAAPLALHRATEGLQGPLRAELERTLGVVDLGGRWRDELQDLAQRLRLADLTRTVALLTRTEVLGSSLTDASVSLAATVRAARRAAVTQRARTAPVKMLFPLVFLVLPAFLLLTVVPVLLTTLRSIG